MRTAVVPPYRWLKDESSSSTLSAWDTVHTLQLCVNIITCKMLSTVDIIIAVILWERDGQPLKGHSSHYGQKELPGSSVDNGSRGKRVWTWEEATGMREGPISPTPFSGLPLDFRVP